LQREYILMDCSALHCIRIGYIATGHLLNVKKRIAIKRG
jgi:hypothetical protein